MSAPVAGFRTHTWHAAVFTWSEYIHRGGEEGLPHQASVGAQAFAGLDVGERNAFMVALERGVLVDVDGLVDAIKPGQRDPGCIAH